ncbi:MAG TPA: periplasmic heavy metal sensor [Polyangiaceae bacterium]|jgi:hypothetical protein|nr:periplasmic heavy metal sensor [Polyangiaceae bacterium]
MTTIRWMLLPMFLSVAVPAWAAPPPPATTPVTAPSGDPGDRPFETMRSRILRERVGLTEEKAVRVETILKKYAPERKRINGNLKESRQKLRALVTLNSDDQGAYKSALEGLRTNRKALADLMDRAFGEVSKELTAKEQGKLFLVLDNMRGRLGARLARRGPGGRMGPANQ